MRYPCFRLFPTFCRCCRRRLCLHADYMLVTVVVIAVLLLLIWGADL